jgi:hypothetical protein
MTLKEGSFIHKEEEKSPSEGENRGESVLKECRKNEKSPLTAATNWDSGIMKYISKPTVIKL